MSSLDRAREVRTNLKSELDGLLAADAPTAESQDRAAELVSAIKAQDELVAETTIIEARAAQADAVSPIVHEERAVPAYDSVARVTREERTYDAVKATRGEAGFFSDMWRAEKAGDVQARGRLERHMNEARVENELESRAVATSGFAGLVVPQYLVDQAALALRNGRPFANICTKLPLPDQGMSLILPRGTTGVSAAIQATENSSVSSTDEVWANVTLPVATIAGQQIVSRQSLERGTPGLDQLVYLDIAGAYAAALDTQLFSGSGSSNQVLGINVLSGTNAATAFAGTPSATNVYLKVAGAIQSIAGAGTAISAKAILMHPRRFGWLSAQVDGQGRPLIVPTVDMAWNALGINSYPGGYSGDAVNAAASSVRVMGYLHGLPVITDANVPTAVGTNSEDMIFVVDTAQTLLFENGDGAPKFMQFDATNVTTLGVTIVGYNYAAFTAGRYPVAVSKIGGLDTTATYGLVAPSF